MPTALPLPDRIGQQMTRDVEQRVFQAQFGDGYWLTVADGPNNIMEKVNSVSWNGLNLTERNIVTAALKKGATDYLTWTPVDGTAKKYLIQPISSGRGMVKLYTEQFESGGLYSITTNLAQVP